MCEALGNPPFGRELPPNWLPEWEEGVKATGAAVVRSKPSLTPTLNQLVASLFSHRIQSILPFFAAEVPLLPRFAGWARASAADCSLSGTFTEGVPA